MTRILIVEDEPRLRQDLGDFLELRGFVVTRAASAHEMRKEFTEGLTPAAIVLDVGLPDGNGFDLAAEVRQNSDCGIVMLTAFADSADRIRGFDSGADVYLVKDSTLREVEAAIRSVLRRTGQQQANVDRRGADWRLDTASWSLATPEGHVLQLTATEFAFLNFLCRRPGQICGREQLVAALGRPHVHFDNRRLDAVVSRLRRKFEKATVDPSAIKVVYGVGYTFTAPVTIG